MGDKVVVGGGLRVLGVRLRTGLIKNKNKKDKVNIMHEIYKYNKIYINIYKYN